MPESQRDSVRSMGDYADLLRRRWIYPALIAPAVLLLAVFLAYWLTPLYRSSATLMLEPSSIPADMVRTTVTSYADQQIELVRRQAMSRQRIVELVGRVDPYPDEKGLSAEDKAKMVIDDTTIERVDPVTLEPLKESTAFSIHYDNPDPEIAADVASELAQLFLTFNRETRTEQATQAYEFLKVKEAEIDRTVRDLGAKIAAFKRRYANALPDDQGNNRSSIDRAIRDLDLVEPDIRAAQERVAVLELQLSQTSPTLTGAASDTRTEIATLRAQLAEAEQKYSEDHPDVRRLRRAIEQLAVRGPTAGGDAGQANNPQYLQIQTELQSARSSLAALRNRAARARAEISAAQNRLSLAPSVEREYLKLVSDRDAAQEQLTDTQRKLREAQFATRLESESRGERYLQIRQPTVSDSPIFPNRLGFILMGVVLALGLGLGAMALVESTDPSIRSARDVAETTDLPILGTIPTIETSETRSHRAKRLRLVSFAYGLATVVVLVTVIRAMA
jgi:polysaccharide chain length determinant protein (PEP-CTERM system associated)